jgi:hypothetical protein
VARIDAPRLSSTTFSDNIDFDTPELNRFISRTPILGAYDEARLVFLTFEALVRLRQTHPEGSDHRMVKVIISSNAYGRQLSTVAKICTLSLRTTENVYIDADGEDDSPLIWRAGMDASEWLDLLLSFTAVKHLYLSKLISPLIAFALHWQELTGGRTTEVLPVLQNVFLEGFQPSEPVQERIARFISARQLTDHLVAVSVWDRDLVGNKS